MHFKPDLTLLLLLLLLEQNKINGMNLNLSTETSHISSKYLCRWWPELAMDWTVRGLNPGGGRIFCVLQASTQAHLTSCTKVLGLTQG